MEKKTLTHKEIKAMYVKLFPSRGVKQYWRKGEKGILVKGLDGKTVVFTYHGPDNWKIETPAMYEKSKDGV